MNDRTTRGRLIIGWRCDECEQKLGDEPKSYDIAEKLRKDHEEETGHTTTVEVIREQRIVASQTDRLNLGEYVVEMADGEIEWICPKCKQRSADLGTTKRCPDCGERYREVLPDGGTVD